VLFSVLVACQPSPSQEPVVLEGVDFEPLVEQILTDLAASEAPGVSVAVMLEGEVAWAGAYGSAHPSQQVEVTADTLFQIGSTTKMLTAIAVLKRVEAGQAQLDDPLGVHLPDFDLRFDPGAGGDITLRHLLTHSSGLYDWIDWGGSPNDDALYEWVHGDFSRDSWLMNDPGAFWNYSNPNFVLAGLVAEELGGAPYVDQLTADVLDPLGMDRTFSRLSQVEADGDYALGTGIVLGEGYSYSVGDVLLESIPDPASARPAGSSTWSTPTQMLQVASLLMGDRPDVLDESLRTQMVSPQLATLDRPDAEHYGYGVFVRGGAQLLDGYYPVSMLEHGGNTLSYTSDFYVLPDHGFAISILSSGEATDFSSSVAVAMETLVDLGEPVPSPVWTFDPARLDDHVGTYRDANFGTIEVTRSGDELHVSMPLLERYGYQVRSLLEAESSSLFWMVLDGYYYDLTFIPSADGGSSEYIRNREFVGVRVE